MLYENDRRVGNGICSRRGVEAAAVKFRGMFAIILSDAYQRMCRAREWGRERDLVKPPGEDRVRLDNGTRAYEAAIAGGDECFQVAAESGAPEIDEDTAVSGDNAK